MKILTFFIIFYCLFGFKFNLVPYADTGIRLDDFLILFFGLLLLYKGKLIINTPILLLLSYVAWSLLSTIINTQLTEISLFQGVLFSLRNLEYLIFFYVGVYFRQFYLPLTPLLKTYLLYSIVIVGLIYIGVISGTSNFHYSRAFANTNGPYEYVVLLAFLTVYFIHNKNYIHATLSFVMMFFTQSRITIAAYILVQFLLVKRKTKLLYIPVLFLLFVPILPLISETLPYMERFSSLLDSKTLDSILSLVSRVEIVSNHQEYLDAVYNHTVNSTISTMGGDTSALIRFNKWVVLVLSTINANSFSFFLGLGPSFASVGVDGNYVRIFAESGIVGLIIFLAFLKSLLNYAKKHKEVVLYNFVLILAISAIFIDILVSYKVMLLIWFYFGYLYQKNRASSCNQKK